MNMPVGYQSELISHEGAEFSYVLSGQIVYTIEGRQYPSAPATRCTSTRPRPIAWPTSAAMWRKS